MINTRNKLKFGTRQHKLKVKRLNWTWNYLIIEIRDPIVKCQKFRGQVENCHFQIWTAPFLNQMLHLLPRPGQFQQETCNCRSWDTMQGVLNFLFWSTHGWTWLTPKMITTFSGFINRGERGRTGHTERERQKRTEKINREDRLARNRNREHWPIIVFAAAPEPGRREIERKQGNKNKKGETREYKRRKQSNQRENRRTQEQRDHCPRHHQLRLRPQLHR